MQYQSLAEHLEQHMAWGKPLLASCDQPAAAIHAIVDSVAAASNLHYTHFQVALPSGQLVFSRDAWSEYLCQALPGHALQWPELLRTARSVARKLHRSCDLGKAILPAFAASMMAHQQLQRRPAHEVRGTLHTVGLGSVAVQQEALAAVHELVHRHDFAQLLLQQRQQQPLPVVVAGVAGMAAQLAARLKQQMQLAGPVQQKLYLADVAQPDRLPFSDLLTAAAEARWHTHAADPVQALCDGAGRQGRGGWLDHMATGLYNLLTTFVGSVGGLQGEPGAQGLGGLLIMLADVQQQLDEMWEGTDDNGY
jgi:hypothetical protein